MTVNKNDPYVVGGPFTRVQGDAYPYVISYPGATTISAPSCKIYIKGSDTDLTTTNLSGSSSTNGSTTITTPIVQSLAGGETYILVISATVDGRTDYKLLEMQVLFPWAS